MPYAPPAMARALEALVRFYRTGQTTEDRRAYDIAWVAGPRVAGRHDQRLRRGLHGCARPRRARGRRSSTTSTARRPPRSHASPSTRSGSRTACRGIRSTASREVTGVTARAIDVIVETGDSGPVTPIGINLPNDQEIRETLRQQVGLAVERAPRRTSKSTPRAFRSEFALGRGRGRRAPCAGARSPASSTTNLHEVIGHGSGLVSEP